MNATGPLVTCPGCGLESPPSGREYDRKFHASAECWAFFEEVIGREFQSAALFGRAHQLTVDTYAVQHAGGAHPDKSVGVHLAGLCLSLERGIALTDVPLWMQRIAGATTSWPHLEPPMRTGGITVRDVAAARSEERHVAVVRAWAGQVWTSWSAHHPAARALAERGTPGVARPKGAPAAPHAPARDARPGRRA